MSLLLKTQNSSHKSDFTVQTTLAGRGCFVASPVIFGDILFLSKTNSIHSDMFKDATRGQINKAMTAAHTAFATYKTKSGRERAAFLRAIADGIEALGDPLIETAMAETHLPKARLEGERGRTCFQLRQMADTLAEGSWCEATIDTALPDRQPLPRPDLRKMLVPMGTVVVFGSSNFPLAYSAAGVDTASALAAGCSVVVKAHPAHPQTSKMVADAIEKAIKKTKMPKGVYQHVFGASQKVGKTLVQHPLAAAVGFTGSFAGGKALFDLAAKRPVPIPVFSEMGSTNPVVILPKTLATDFEKTAAQLASSMTLGMGQFCTQPGLIFIENTEGGQKFIQSLAKEMGKIAPAMMLHAGICQSFNAKSQQVLTQNGVKLVGKAAKTANEGEATPSVATVAAAEFLKNPTLHQEVFGPFSLVVVSEDKAQTLEVLRHLEGQLTATLIGSEAEIGDNLDIAAALQNICGRLVFNGVPTGVEVANAMVHGGPFPATTDPRFTSVGPSAIKRWVRPVSFQNCPDAFLPEELKAANLLSIWRMVNGNWQK
jgi:2,5-dioxopentanoate dehydrogenase